MIVPISQLSLAYAKECLRRLRREGFHADVDSRDQKMQRKVREAQLAQYNYILVVGEKEQAEVTVNVRTRDNIVHGMHKLDAVVSVLHRERSSRSRVGLWHDAEAAVPADSPAEAPAALAGGAAPGVELCI